MSSIVAAGLLGVVAVSLAFAHGSAPSKAPAETSAADARPAGTFSWLTPAPPPKAWGRATIASGGATLSYPSNWKPIPGDKGTVTVALRADGGVYRGYLNVTPRQGAERLAGWAAFRTAHNMGEGDTRVRELAAAEHLRFGDARGSCVIDDYLSRVASHPYREVACLIAGARYTSVFVGATLRADWPSLGGAVERAAASLIER